MLFCWLDQSFCWPLDGTIAIFIHVFDIFKLGVFYGDYEK